MNKKILFTGIVISFAIPSTFLVSCVPSNKLRDDLREHEYLVKKEIQDSQKRVQLNFSKIERQNIEDFSANLNNFYKTPMASSGYGETRKFYSDGYKSIYRHTGVDAFLNKGEKILAPSGAEVISAYWLQRSKEWASGIGGVVCLRLKISELNIPSELKEYVYVKKSTKIFKVPKVSFSENGIYKEPKLDRIQFVSKQDYDNYLNKKSSDEKDIWKKASEYVYLRIMHLSKNTPNLLSRNVKTVKYKTSSSNTTLKITMDIDWNNPRKMNRGETIAFVGGHLENGGWAPHIDVNLYSVLATKILKRWTEFKLKPNLSDSKIISEERKLNAIGVEIVHNTKNKMLLRKESILKLKGDGNFDPNEIFNFYQDDDKQVTVEKI